MPPKPDSLSAMEARTGEALPSGPWQYEPKWDGFRCLAFKTGSKVELMAKSGKPLTRNFPKVAAALAKLSGSWVLDGELVIPVGQLLSFDALQMRLHSSESRIRKLAGETPAILILFDLLASGKVDYTGKPLTVRRSALEELFDAFGAITACRPQGTISLPGVFINIVPVAMGAVVGKALTIKTGQTHVQRYLAPLMKRIEDGEIDPSFLITHRISLDEGPEAYKTFRDKKDGCIKVVIKPNG